MKNKENLRNCLSTEGPKEARQLYDLGYPEKQNQQDIQINRAFIRNWAQAIREAEKVQELHLTSWRPLRADRVSPSLSPSQK